MKREKLMNWMRGGIILISVLLMGLSSFKCPSSDVDQLGPGDESDESEYRSLMEGILGQDEGKTPAGQDGPGKPPRTPDEEQKRKDHLKKSMSNPARGQTFILSLNTLAGKNDSDIYTTDAKGNKSAVSGIESYDSAAKTVVLDPTIEANIDAWQPGGIYISAPNLEALAEEGDVKNASLGKPLKGSLVDPLQALITALKDASEIEPLIVTQEGGQFQRLLTAKVDSSGWKPSRLRDLLGLTVLDSVAMNISHAKLPSISRSPAHKAPDDTPYTWWMGKATATNPQHANAINLWTYQVYELGFSLNYWLVGGTLRGSSDSSLNLSYGRMQTSANVLGYQSLGSQELLSRVVKEYWRKDRTVILIGDFPGKSFADHVEKAPNWVLPQQHQAGAYEEEMEWTRLNWQYFKDEAKEAVKGPAGIDKNGIRGRDRLYYYAEAIKEKVDIVSLSQDPLHNLTPHPWKSRRLIDVLRTEMEFGGNGVGVVMVGDRTALIRDQHPTWLHMNKYAGIGREMSTVVQLNASMVKESLRAGVDLFHLWRFPGKTITYGPYTNKVKLEPETALETIKEILSDYTLDAHLKKARKRVLKMKDRRNYDGT